VDQRKTRWLAVGAVLGFLTSGLLVGAWHRDAHGLSVTVLGAGRQASVLVTSHHRRILLVAGTNGASFSNALADALPPIDKQLDVVLIDPAASQEVLDRARSLRARLIWTLPDAGQPAAADTVERSFSIELDSETSLQLVIDGAGGWHAELRAAAGVLIVSPDAQSLAHQTAIAAAAVLTHAHEDAAINVPLLIALPGISTPDDQHVRIARPGSTIRLEISNREIRVPSD
jgi:hypothetical protein